VQSILYCEVPVVLSALTRILGRTVDNPNFEHTTAPPKQMMIMMMMSQCQVTYPGSVDQAPGVHQAKPMLMTVGKSGLVTRPQSIMFIHLYKMINCIATSIAFYRARLSVAVRCDTTRSERQCYDARY